MFDAILTSRHPPLTFTMFTEFLFRLNNDYVFSTKISGNPTVKTYSRRLKKGLVPGVSSCLDEYGTLTDEL